MIALTFAWGATIAALRRDRAQHDRRGHRLRGARRRRRRRSTATRSPRRSSRRPRRAPCCSASSGGTAASSTASSTGSSTPRSSALGFAMTENVLYYGRGAAEEGIVGAVVTFVVRGADLAVRPSAVHRDDRDRAGDRGHDASNRVLRVAAPLGGLAAAMVLHSLWNTARRRRPLLRRLLPDHGPDLLRAVAGDRLRAAKREGRVIATQLSGAAARGGGARAGVAPRPAPGAQARRAARRRRRPSGR